MEDDGPRHHRQPPPASRCQASSCFEMGHGAYSHVVCGFGGTSKLEMERREQTELGPNRGPSLERSDSCGLRFVVCSGSHQPGFGHDHPLENPNSRCAGLGMVVRASMV